MSIADIAIVKRESPAILWEPKDIVLSWPGGALSPNARVHWAVKNAANKAARKEAKIATLQAGWRRGEIEEADLWVYFYPPDRRKRDDDNLSAAFKPYRDGIADAFGINDNRLTTNVVLLKETGKKMVVRVVSTLSS